MGWWLRGISIWRILSIRQKWIFLCVLQLKRLLLLIFRTIPVRDILRNYLPAPQVLLLNLLRPVYAQGRNLLCILILLLLKDHFGVRPAIFMDTFHLIHLKWWPISGVFAAFALAAPSRRHDFVISWLLNTVIFWFELSSIGRYKLTCHSFGATCSCVWDLLFLFLD